MTWSRDLLLSMSLWEPRLVNQVLFNVCLFFFSNLGPNHGQSLSAFYSFQMEKSANSMSGLKSLDNNKFGLLLFVFGKGWSSLLTQLRRLSLSIEVTICSWGQFKGIWWTQSWPITRRRLWRHLCGKKCDQNLFMHHNKSWSLLTITNFKHYYPGSNEWP